MKTIVVPVVDSPAGRRALEHAKEAARENDGVVILVATANVVEHVAANVEAVKERLSQLEKEMAEEGIRCQVEWYVGESLGEACLYTAAEHEADLIVMSLRRRTPVGKALLGSFEQEILLGAQCPILCFPAGMEQS